MAVELRLFRPEIINVHTIHSQPHIQMAISVIHDASDAVLDLGEKPLGKSRKCMCLGIIMLDVATVESYPHSAIRSSMDSGNAFLQHSLLMREMFECLCFTIKDIYLSVLELHPYGVTWLMIR